MIVEKADGNLWMKQVYCSTCGTYRDRKPIPIKDKPPRCRYCKRIMEIKWENIGDKLDHSEYFSDSNARRMRRKR